MASLTQTKESLDRDTCSVRPSACLVCLSGFLSAGFSNAAEKSTKKEPMCRSRNGTWEGLALVQMTRSLPLGQSRARSEIRQHTPGNNNFFFLFRKMFETFSGAFLS